MEDPQQLRQKLSTSSSGLLLGRVYFIALLLGVFYMHGDLIFLKRKIGTISHCTQTLGFLTWNFKTYNGSLRGKKIHLI